MLHLYDPRIVVPGSIMPPFSWLFEKKPTAAPGDIVLNLPDSLKPDGRAIVAGRDAKALVAYLLSLDRTYPISQGTATLKGK